MKTQYNVTKKKLGAYEEAMVDTPFNREVQAELDYWNNKLPKYVKLFGYQEQYKTDKTIEIMAMAMKGCPDKYIGGNNSLDLGWSDKAQPEGVISNFIGIGMNGSIEVGYKHIISSIKYAMKNCRFLNKKAGLGNGYKLNKKGMIIKEESETNLNRFYIGKSAINFSALGKENLKRLKAYKDKHEQKENK